MTGAGAVAPAARPGPPIEGPGAYWARTLDDGVDFMRAVDAHPVHDEGEPLAAIAPAARAAGVRVDCTATHHRTGRRLDLRLRRSNVDALLGVAARLQDDGLLLVVHDAVRSPLDQARLGRDPRALATIRALLHRHGLRPSDERLVAWLGVIIAATPRTAGHIAGAAVDVSVRLADGGELDRGATYPDWSERMPMDSPFLTPTQVAARARVNTAMAANGFLPLPFEFWHYSRGDAVAAIAAGAAEPARFGPVTAQPSGSLVPYSQATRFNDPALLARLFHDRGAAE